MKRHFLGYRIARRIDTQKVRKRNSALTARYYYLSELKRLRFDDVVARLTATFFLSDATVLRILNDSNDEFTTMCEERPGREYLKANWPEFDWN